MTNTALRLGGCCVAFLVLVSGCDSSKLSSAGDGGADVVTIRLDSLPAARDTRPGTDGPGASGLDGRDVPGGGGAPGVGDAQGVPGADGPLLPGSDAMARDGRPGVEVAPPHPNPDGGGTPCGLAGALCSTAADCCGLACVAGMCAAAACLTDGASCTSGGQCCSSMCGSSGTCAPLNPLCKTAGNACTNGSECCNGVCNANHQCAPPGQVSYCNQTGDVCRADVECCTGVCKLASGTGVGTCATITTSCLVDGTVCNGCGECCSHFCGPFGAGGPDICQPASGCRVEGDLCHQDSDCCGGDPRSGMPGAGLVRCEPDPVYGARIGTCGGPRASNCPDGTDTCKHSCNPEGNVCHYTDTAICAGATTSQRNDCCACISGKECCKLDRTGIPRCNALEACVPVGGSCAFSGDCCNGLPCVPDPVTGRLTCGATCVPMGGLCTTNADCCVGALCQVAPGSLAGTCGVPTSPPGTDAGVPRTDGGVGPGPDGAVPGTDSAADDPDAIVAPPDLAPPPPFCSYFGQSCSTSQLCCEGMTCVNVGFADCTPADTDCICIANE